MAKLVDPWDHHDWSSKQYVSEWAEGQDEREADRKKIFSTIAKIISSEPQAAVKILDIGAGYGALTQYLLNHFPNATAICQDGSAEMAKLGRKRMESLKERFQYVLCDFSKPGWSQKVKGPFDSVVSSIAIHNVRAPDIIRSIYKETFSLVKPGRWFLNFDRMTPSQKEQVAWLQAAGFADVKCFWDGGRRAILGGYKKS